VLEFGLLRPPRHVLFGDGSLEAIAGVTRPFGGRFLVCTDAGIAASGHLDRLLACLGAAGVRTTVWDTTEPELPLAGVTDAIRFARRADIGGVIGFGGGSSLDLAKLVALGCAHGEDLRPYITGARAVPGPVMPLVAIPTTAGTGSEVTPVAVLTDPTATLKVGVSSPHLVPDAAIVDPTLTHGCPPAVTAYAGIDALAHAIEAYIARSGTAAPENLRGVFVGKNSLSDVFALEAIAKLAPNLAAATRDDHEARTAVAYGSLAAGLAFATAGTAAAHALQYPIGARTHTPHGLGTGLLLPHVMRFNRPERIAELARVAAAAGWATGAGAEADADAAIDGVARLGRSLGLPGSLRDLEVSEDELPEMAALAAGITRLAANNPRPLELEGALAILRAAWSASRPDHTEVAA
jgi:alcohol dehydrogenase